VEVLGPVRVWRGPQLVDLGPTKQRALFAALVLRAGEFVSVGRLLDSVWGEHRPPSARQLIHTYMARLRQVFEPDAPRRQRVNVIGSGPSGYRLLIARDQIDLSRFNQLFAQAHRSASAGEPARAFDLLGEAIRLWRDPELEELTGMLREGDDLTLLRRSWMDAAVLYVQAGLDVGQAPAVLPVAHVMAAAEPLREDAQALLLALLNKTGQRTAAIDHFNNVRVQLNDELGVPPGPELSETYRRVLQSAEQPSAADVVPGHPAQPPRPPWRGLGPVAGNLIQRDEDLAASVRILNEHRVLTLTGPPGCGKSALALHAAAESRDGFLGGVAVLDCSDLRCREQVAGGLCRLFDGSPDRADLASLIDDQQVLVVLDNVEHLVEGCAVLVDEIVRACRHVSIVVTSREPLGLSYETRWPVRPLAVPEPDAAGSAGDIPAVRLFTVRAAQVDPGFRLGPDNVDAVAEICRRLAGLPLAIEMAAACLITDTVDGVVKRLDGPLRLIKPARRDRPIHQRSLWAALTRSSECLTEHEHWCFRTLGRLPRHFTLSAVQRAWQATPWGRVDAAAVLNRLVEKSLLGVEHRPDEPHYVMLWLLHKFAAELDAQTA
jgi:predicted ATPase/DNA-binding SARP family transcriptional activator